jgi:hypothetical protein
MVLLPTLVWLLISNNGATFAKVFAIGQCEDWYGSDQGICNTVAEYENEHKYN